MRAGLGILRYHASHCPVTHWRRLFYCGAPQAQRVTTGACEGEDCCVHAYLTCDELPVKSMTVHMPYIPTCVRRNALLVLVRG